MRYVYDARNPIRPGIVSPVPRPKVRGLSEAQKRGLREFDPSSGEMYVKCEKLGIVSTLRTLDKASPILPTRSSIPGNRRRSPKGRPQSLCHLAKKDGKSMEKAVQKKVALRRERDRNREIERCVRKCQRAIKLGLIGVAVQMLRRLKKLDRNQLTLIGTWANARQLGSRLDAAMLQLAA